MKISRAGLATLRFCLLLYFFNKIVARLPSHTLRDYLYGSLMRIRKGRHSSIHMGLQLYTRGGINVGDNTIIDRDCTLDARGGIEIGSNVNLAPEVMILTASHDPDSADFAGYAQPVKIGDRVWIATRAMVLPGVTIGTRAVVGAGAVVTRDVEPGAIVAGNPARKIRERQGCQQYRLVYRRPFH